MLFQPVAGAPFASFFITLQDRASLVHAIFPTDTRTKEAFFKIVELFCGAFRFCPSSQVGHVDRLGFCNRGATIRIHGDGLWELDVHHDAVANRKRIELQRRAHAEKLARMRRVLPYAFRGKQPEALVLP